MAEKEALEEWLAGHEVLLLSKTWCPFCRRIKRLLEEQHVEYTALELDTLPEAPELTAGLRSITGTVSVPALFVRGQFLGGSTEVEQAIASGVLAELLTGNPVPSSFMFDIFVVGGGVAGLATAMTAAKLHARVGLADYVVPSPAGTRWGLGGTCVNAGCIPKKLMHRAGLIATDLEDAPFFGWKGSSAEHQWGTLVENTQAHIKSLNWGYRKDLLALGVQYFNCRASFKDKHTLLLRNGYEQEVTARNIVLAVGCRPHYPDLPGALEACITSDDLFSLPESPGRTLIVGGSYVALECAGFLQQLGCPITIMVRCPNSLLRSMDQDLVARLRTHLESLGVIIVEGCLLVRATRVGGEVRAEGRYEDGGEYKGLFKTVLLAVGRDPNTGDLGLESVGIKTNCSGKVVVDERDETSVRGVFAVGDVAAGRPALTPVARLAGRLLARRLCGDLEAGLLDTRFTPTTVFTPLELGSVGETEARARECRPGSEAPVKVHHSLFRPLETVLTQRTALGCYAKVITVSDSVVGLHILGPNAAEILQGFALAIKSGVSSKDLQRLFGLHPSSAEVFTNLRPQGEPLSELGSGC